jgi:hypothetical protein
MGSGECHPWKISFLHPISFDVIPRVRCRPWKISLPPFSSLSKLTIALIDHSFDPPQFLYEAVASKRTHAIAPCPQSSQQRGVALSNEYICASRAVAAT